MFSFRRETDYAIQLLKFLSHFKVEYVSLRKVSDSTGISFHFLQKIARKLRMARLINGGKGVEGGYCLNLSPAKINLLMIAGAMGDKSVILPCYLPANSVKCAKYEKKCLLKNKLRKINCEINKLLQGAKLSDL